MTKSKGTTTEKQDEHGIVKAQRELPSRSLFRDFEQAMMDMERRVDRLIREASEGSIMPSLPLLHGLTLQEDEKGRPQFRPFGNLAETIEALEEGWREPLLTWELDDAQENVIFTAEVPGVKKDDLEVTVEPDRLEIKADTDDRRYRATCSPGYRLDPDRTEAHHEDGVLTIEVALAEPVHEKAKKIPID